MTKNYYRNRNVLVTGGGRGIGRASALRLASEGANVAVSYASRREEAESTAAEIEKFGVKATVLQEDVSVREDAQQLAMETREALGPIDILVHSGAICVHEPVDEVTWENWQRTFEVNVHGTFHMIYAVKDEMIERGFGRIVTLASIAGLRPRPRLPHYAASKGAVNSFSTGLAQEVIKQGIRVNTLAPGLTETDMTRDTLDRRAGATPMGRAGKPEEIAQGILFLLSDEASYIACANLRVSGGKP